MGGTIRSVGSALWGVEKIEASVTLNLEGGRPKRVVACDENGYPSNVETTVSEARNTVTVQIGDSLCSTGIPAARSDWGGILMQ